jgi:hypothetical protein
MNTPRIGISVSRMVVSRVDAVAVTDVIVRITVVKFLELEDGSGFLLTEDGDTIWLEGDATQVSLNLTRRVA